MLPVSWPAPKAVLTSSLLSMPGIVSGGSACVTISGLRAGAVHRRSADWTGDRRECWVDGFLAQVTGDDMSLALRAAELFSKPDIYILEFQGPHAVLVPMSRESYRQSIFTDRGRIVTAGEQIWAVEQAHLVDLHESLGIEPQPLRYIFHTAHCGSTLLARAFEGISDCLVYREPYPLRQLAVAFVSEIRTPQMRGGWDQLLRLICTMLGRRFDESQPVLVKANVPVNFVLPQVLGLHPDSTGILLYSSLRTFLLNGMKSPAHQQWVRQVVNETSPAIKSIEAMAAVELATLSPAQAASCLWLAQMYQYTRILQARGGLRTLDCETFFERPFETLQAVCEFFGLDPSEDELLTVVAGELFSKHAKFPGLRYDAAIRRADLESQALAFADQVSEGMAWADHFLGPLGIPAVLPDALL